MFIHFSNKKHAVAVLAYRILNNITLFAECLLAFIILLFVTCVAQYQYFYNQ